jgi:hypothetical protein
VGLAKGNMGILPERDYFKIFKLDWRLSFYCAFVWLQVVLISGFIVLPWYFFALPLAVFITTVIYFRIPNNELYKSRFNRETLFAQGLWLGFAWFFAILIMDFVEFVNFDLQNFYVYLLDSRNFLKFPVVILIPVIYSLVLEQQLKNKSKFAIEQDLGVGASI